MLHQDPPTRDAGTVAAALAVEGVRGWLMVCPAAVGGLSPGDDMALILFEDVTD